MGAKASTSSKPVAKNSYTFIIILSVFQQKIVILLGDSFANVQNVLHLCAVARDKEYKK